jgi:hypothetical protein
MNILVSDSLGFFELENNAHRILNEKYIVHKLQNIARFLWPNIHQLRRLSTQEKEEETRDVQVIVDEYKRQE